MASLQRSAKRTASAVIAVMMLFAALYAITSYYSEDKNIKAMLNSSASALDYQTGRSLRAVDDLLTDVARRVDLDTWPDPTLVMWLQGRLAAYPEVNNIAVIRANGWVMSPALTAEDRINYSIDVTDREYFRYHQAHPRDRDLHIGVPLVSHLDSSRGLPVSKAIFNRQGDLIGIIRAQLRPDVISQAMGTMQTYDFSFNTLIRSDGVILARSPEMDLHIGKSVANGELFRRIIRHEPNGVGVFPSPFDGTSNIVAYRTSQHFNMVVLTGVPSWDAFANWRLQIYWVVALLVGLSTALYVVSMLSDHREGQRLLLSEAASEAERKMQRSQQQFLDAIETISDGFALYDEQDHLVVCNAQYRAMYAEAEDVITPGNSFADISRVAGERGIYCHKGSALADFIGRLLAEHNTPTGRARLHPLSGGRWIISKEFRTRDGGVVATRTDVTELRKREEEVEALKKRYELILGAAGDGIFGINRDEVIMFANRAAYQALGMPEGSLIGKNFRDAVCGHDFCAVLPVLSELDEVGASGEGMFGRADGGSFIAEYMLAPIREEHGFEGAVLVFRDISLRKLYEAGIADQQKALEQQVAERTRKLSTEIEQRSRTEEALRKSQGRLLGITSNLFEGVILVDTFGHILFANPSAHRLLVSDDQHLPGTDLDETMRVLQNGKPVDFLDGPMVRVVETGETMIDDDAVFLTHDNRRLCVGYAVAALVEEGKRRGAVVSFRSIEALKTAQREAVQSSRLATVGQLAAGIAHEINTPIQYVGDNLRFTDQSIGSLGETLKEARKLLEQVGQGEAAQALFEAKDVDYLMEELPQAISQSLQGVSHVAHIVRSMKEFSHPGTTAKVATDINRAIDSTITVSRNEWKHVAAIETDLAADLPLVECFPAEINQVFLNLIVNAAHAIESKKQTSMGQIRIATRLLDGKVEIRVADSGPGVPLEIREKIFDPFFTTKEVGRGTGQGLSICQDVVVNKHGGRLYLDDTVPVGATFVIVLPLKGSGTGKPLEQG